MSYTDALEIALSHAEALQAQRDELVAALRDCRDALSRNEFERESARRRAETALAKVTK